METSTSHKEELKIGSEVFLDFKKGDPKGAYDLISVEAGRKHIVPHELSEDPVPGIEYKVRLVAETKTGMMGGVYKANIEKPSKFGELQLQMREKGYIYKESYRKQTFSEDQISTIHKGIGDGDFIITEMSKSLKGDGEIDPNRYGVWLKDPDINFELPTNKEVESSNQLPIDAIQETNLIRFLNIVVDGVDSEGKLVPSKESFRHFALDQRTMRNIYLIASAWQRRSPLMLEGDTDASKTSSVDYFAAQIGAEVEAINLSGQTDTTELIGKYVPNDDSQRFRFESLVSGYSSADESERQKTYKRVGAKAEAILKSAYEEGRALTDSESSEVAHLNGMDISDKSWVWMNGKVVDAAINGKILRLDEVKLAEPQVIERLNSLLDVPPSLVLGEKGGVKIGPGGDFDIHPNFWIVGTTNPGGMAGRAEHSDAFMRRWRDYVQVEAPTEEDYQSMLKFLIYGEQPEFSSEGVTFQGKKADNPIYGNLAKEDRGTIGLLIENLSKFHMEMRNLAHPETGAPTFGKEKHRKGGRYTFTRANLMSAIEYIAKEKILDLKKTISTGSPVYSDDLKKKISMAIDRFYVSPAYSEDRAGIRATWNKYGFAGLNDNG